jgi:catabolite regulation protein CreA
MNDVDNNYFREGKSLTEGCFPQLEALYVYDPYDEEKNTFTAQSFPAKVQATSLRHLCTSVPMCSYPRREFLL